MVWHYGLSRGALFLEQVLQAPLQLFKVHDELKRNKSISNYVVTVINRLALNGNPTSGVGTPKSSHGVPSDSHAW